MLGLSFLAFESRNKQEMGTAEIAGKLVCKRLFLGEVENFYFSQNFALGKAIGRINNNNSSSKTKQTNEQKRAHPYYSASKIR